MPSATPRPPAVLAFAGSDAFAIAGTPIAEDAALLELGLDLSLSANATLGIAYKGQFAAGANQNGVDAKLNVRFLCLIIHTGPFLICTGMR